MDELTREDFIVIREALFGSISEVHEYIEDENARKHIREIETVLVKIHRILKKI